MATYELLAATETAFEVCEVALGQQQLKP